MSSINDFATTYMCQSLPFGGVKHSGFDRFAGGSRRLAHRLDGCDSLVRGHDLHLQSWRACLCCA